VRSVPALATLPVIVRLSSERARQAVRQDCSFATKQESRPALLVVVRSGRLMAALRQARKPGECGSAPDGPRLDVPAAQLRGTQQQKCLPVR
jgi:hypothetical protein